MCGGDVNNTAFDMLDGYAPTIWPAHNNGVGIDNAPNALDANNAKLDNYGLVGISLSYKNIQQQELVVIELVVIELVVYNICGYICS